MADTATIPNKRGGTGRFWLVVLILLVVFGILFVVGLLPRLRQGHKRDDAAQTERTAKPVVLVLPAQRAPDTTALRLPADLRSLHETFVFARVNGFVQSWTSDIGKHVRKGQVLATIATPELDQ
ncbi:MAG: efflux RND transporter periplasmic adaptor subunit, partial [Cytophagaceae bacterium]